MGKSGCFNLAQFLQATSCGTATASPYARMGNAADDHHTVAIVRNDDMPVELVLDA
jgi:hypothetical protein